MAKPVLLFVDQHVGLGGGQRLLLSLATAFPLRDRWDVVFAVPGEGWLTERLTEAGIETSQYSDAGIRDGPKRPVDSIKYGLLFWRQVRQFRFLVRRRSPQFVYTSSPRCVLQLLLAAQGTGTRVIFHIQHFYRNAMQERFLRSVLSSSKISAIITPSIACQRWAQQALGNRAKLAHVPNWLTMESAEDAGPTSADTVRALPHSSESSFRFGVVGRLVRLKGQDVFLGAAAKVLAQGEDAEFYLVGGEEYAAHEAYGIALRTAYARDPRIHFLGQVNHMAGVYAQLSCVVVPSRSEVFGLVAIEAMHFGVPLIVSDADELPEIVERGLCGVVVRTDSIDGLAQAMLRVMSDGPLRRAMADRARVTVGLRYSRQAGVGAILALLSRVS